MVTRRQRLQDELFPPRDLAAAIRARFRPFGGVELALAKREPMREPPALRKVVRKQSSMKTSPPRG